MNSSETTPTDPPIKQFPNLQLWLENYAEVLGCEISPASVAVAIQSLKGERDRAIASISEHRKAAQDSIIRGMRQTAVNCGNRQSCAVASWYKLSNEESSKNS